MKKVILITAALMFAAVLGSCSKSESGAGDQVTVIFNAMEGVFTSGESTLDTIINAGDRIAAPVPPVREGYTFDSWCVDQSCITPVSFPALVNTDKIFYAKWSVNPDKWLVSGMSFVLTSPTVGCKLFATYGYDDNNVLTAMTCLPISNGYFTSLDANSISFSSSKRIPLIFKYDGDNVNVITTTSSITDTVASMKLKNGQCQSMAMAMAFVDDQTYKVKDAEMNFSYDASGYLKKAELDTVKKTVMEWTDVNISDYSYSDFKVVYHDTTDAGKDTTWTVSVAYSNSDYRDITGCINVLNPLFLSSVISNTSESLSEVNIMKKNYTAAIPFLFTSPYFETPSTFIPKAFSISRTSLDGTLMAEVLTLQYCDIDPVEGYIQGLEYSNPGGATIIIQFTYTEKK